MMKSKITSKHYYKEIEANHMTGDIWLGLPSFGILKKEKISGMVITPSCDLVNAKVETITYLPILSIKEWLASRAFYYEVRNNFVNLAKDKIQNLEVFLLKNKVPDLSEIEYLESQLLSLAIKSKKENEHISRINSGIQILKSITNNSELTITISTLQHFLGEKQFSIIITKIFRNSYSNDLHFLPSDKEPFEWSAIPDHSLVLFRYPITIPIEILDLATDINCVDWSLAIHNLKSRYLISKEFEDYRPLKTLTLNNDFLSDLLTRFVGLFVRIGSPDFTNETIIELIKEL